MDQVLTKFRPLVAAQIEKDRRARDRESEKALAACHKLHRGPEGRVK